MVCLVADFVGCFGYGWFGQMAWWFWFIVEGLFVCFTLGCLFVVCLLVLFWVGLLICLRYCLLWTCSCVVCLPFRFVFALVVLAIAVVAFALGHKLL